jgi:hypothetical protein
MKKPKHTIVALHAYVGNDEEARKYVQEIKDFASQCNQTVGDFVLDAVEFYIRTKRKPSTLPRIPANLPEKQKESHPIDYSELDDPPAPQVDATSIPDSRPKP